MKEKLINAVKLLFIFLCFFYTSSILLKLLSFLGIIYSDLTSFEIVLISSVSEIILAVIIFLLYRNTLLKDLSIFKENGFVSTLFKYFALFLLVKFVSSVVMIILMFIFKYEPDISENQKTIEGLVASAPILMLFSSSFMTPIVEEGIFRLGIKKVIKNKYLFIVISGALFGFMHIFPTDLNMLFALLSSIPYVAIGITLSIIYEKTNSIYIPIIIHGINNFISILMII